jgi:hypothetical protein
MAEEMYVDEGKDGQITTHGEGTNIERLIYFG